MSNTDTAPIVAIKKNPYHFEAQELGVVPAISSSVFETIFASNINWMSFGIKDSHVLRKELFDIFIAKGLTGEMVFMVYFLTTAIKNKERIETELKKMPSNVKAMDWFQPVHEFFKVNIVQYVTKENFSNKKFAIVHLPSTWPGLCSLCYVLQRISQISEDDEIIDNLKMQSYFGQLWLSELLQDENKEHQKHFWTNVVKKTKNADNKNFEAKFHEDFYANTAGDEYLLIDLEMKAWLPEGAYLPGKAPEGAEDDVDSYEFFGYDQSDLQEFLKMMRHKTLDLEKSLPKKTAEEDVKKAEGSSEGARAEKKKTGRGGR